MVIPISRTFLIFLILFRHLLAVPKSRSSERKCDFISVYLEFQEASYTPRRMFPKAKFELVTVNSISPDDSLKQEATHTFTIEASDWGFAEFIRQRDALNPQTGYLVNDVLTLRVNIKIDNDDPGLTSKLDTGFVGIKSREETSLFGSFLQCLFHIGAVRNFVFQKSTVGFDDLRKSASTALQELFYKLQYQNTSAKMKDLIKALDWNSTNVHLQHDVQRIQHVLLEMLGKPDKASRAKDRISELFMGEYSSYIESPNMQDAPTSKHSFTEISLNVLECKDIYASLEKFCQIKRFVKDNQSHETSHEIGESKHFTQFKSLPTILQFNLKRCRYSPDHGAILKVNHPRFFNTYNTCFQINSHFEFYDELDLDYNDRVWLSKDADQTIENKYTLHSVIVHAEGNGSGQYFTFIRRDDKWFKFEGESVKDVSAEEAISAQFGDRRGTSSANFSKEFNSNNKSAAVMLIYIRKTEWERVMCDYGVTCLPMQIRAALDKEQTEKEKRQKLKQEAHRYVIIKLATEFHFAEQIGKTYYFDLVDFDAVKNYRIHKLTSFDDFQEMVSKDFGIPKHLQRFWKWSKRVNDKILVSKPMMKENINVATVLDLRYLKNKGSLPDQEKTALMTFKLFLESSEEASLNRGISRDTQCLIYKKKLLIFLKYYDPDSSALSYLGHMFVENNCSFCVVFEKAKKMAGLAPEKKVIGFKEVKHVPSVVCTRLSPVITPSEAQLIQGDIIIIQKVTRNRHNEYPTIRSFFGFIQNSRMVNFRPLKNPSNEGLELRMLKTLNYEQVINQLAKCLRVDDPKRLRLTQHNVDTRKPHWRSLKCNGIESLEQMMLLGNQHTNILYYEVLHMQMPYSETVEYLTIAFHDAKGVRQSIHQLMLPKDHTVSDLLKALKVELGEDHEDCDMRIMETLSSRVVKILDPESLVMELDCCDRIYRAEVIPADQKSLRSDEYLVLFCHGKQDGDFLTAFGDPLWVKVKLGEIVRDVKFRIQKTLGISNEEFGHWRFAHHVHPMHPVKYLENQDEILAEFSRITSRKMSGKFFGNNRYFIALVHDDRRANH